MASIRNAEAALNRGGGLTGITTGFTGLNSRIGGLQRSDLIIVAGRPGMGKTALATNMAFSTAERFLQDQADGIDPAKAAGAPVAIFSLEMSAEQLVTRVLSEQS
jgi:replicative DNA helicase